MKNKKQIQNEIAKLRRCLRLSAIPESKKDQLWSTMLALQWVLISEKKAKKSGPNISPTSIVLPWLGRK